MAMDYSDYATHHTDLELGKGKTHPDFHSIPKLERNPFPFIPLTPLPQTTTPLISLISTPHTIKKTNSHLKCKKCGTTESDSNIQARHQTYSEHRNFASRRVWTENMGFYCDRCWDIKSKECTCYLASASTKAMGLPDDNKLVQILTQFRFGWVREQREKLRDLVQYARSAPLIVQQINSRPDASEIYKRIYKKIENIASIIESGDNETAYQHYKKMAVELRERFLQPKNSDINAQPA